jgi:hypothetical protein
MDLKVQEGDLEKVITNIHWRYSGTDEDGVSEETYGCQSVPSPNPEAFTAYEEVTKEMVEEWLESMMDMEELQSRITASIELKKNPVTITLPLYEAPASGSTSGSI